MLKKDLVVLVAQLRTENSLLRTQLAAAQAPKHFAGVVADAKAARTAAIKRLARRYPDRKSFLSTEVAAEIACSA